MTQQDKVKLKDSLTHEDWNNLDNVLIYILEWDIYAMLDECGLSHKEFDDLHTKIKVNLEKS